MARYQVNSSGRHYVFCSFDRYKLSHARGARSGLRSHFHFRSSIQGDPVTGVELELADQL